MVVRQRKNKQLNRRLTHRYRLTSPLHAARWRKIASKVLNREPPRFDTRISNFAILFQRSYTAKGDNMLLIIIVVLLILGFGYGGYRVGPGWGYYGGGGVSLILTIVLILLLLKII
jgi:hypothetical protein